MKAVLAKRCTCRDRDSGKRLESGCPQLRRSDGGWSTRHGTWEYRLELPIRPDGRRRQLRRGGFPDRAAAQAEIDHITGLLTIPAADDDHARDVIAELILSAAGARRALPDEDGVRHRLAHGAALTTRITVGAWLEQWLAGRKNLRPSAVACYESAIRVHLIPHVGAIRLDRLTVGHIEQMFAAIDTRNNEIRAARDSDDPAVRANVRGIRTTGDATKHRIRSCLRAALNTAIRRGMIINNPARLVEMASEHPPKPLLWTDKRVARWKTDGKRPSAVMVWTPTQTGTFLDSVTDDLFGPLYHLIAYRGLRRGEAGGLHWADVDLDAGHLTVRWQLTPGAGTPTLGRPKSDAGNRMIPLDQTTVTVLRERRRAQHTHRLAAGSRWSDTDLVFTYPDGQPLRPDYITTRFKRLVKASGLPPVRLHDLRHGAATFALAAGTDMKIVQELLGHSTIVLTSNTYTTVLPELATRAADDIARLIPRTRAHG